MENKADILNSLVNLPQKLKDNTESIEKVNQEIKEVKRQLGTVIAGFTKSTTTIEKIRESIKIEDLKEVEEKFDNTIKLLREDLNSVIIRDVTNQFENEIDNIIKPKIADINKANTELLNTINNVYYNFRELEKQQEQLKQGIKELERIIKKDMVQVLLRKFYIFLFSLIFSLFYLRLIQINKNFFDGLGLIIIIILGLMLILSLGDLIYNGFLYIFGTASEED